jgi:hypothetical protein
MDQADNINFFGRFTTIVGNTAVVSDPYDVTGYKSIDIEALLHSVVPPVTGVPTVDVSLEMSADMNVWSTVDGPDTLAAGTPAQLTRTSPSRYIRVRVTITGGTNPVITFWVKGVARAS